MSQVCRSEFCLFRYKNLHYKVDVVRTANDIKIFQKNSKTRLLHSSDGHLEILKGIKEDREFLEDKTSWAATPPMKEITRTSQQLMNKGSKDDRHCGPENTIPRT